MNAQIGKNVNHKFSICNTSNRNGQHLTDFTRENRLTCLNTNFQIREGKLFKGVSEDTSTNSFPSNHCIVMAKIWQSLWKNATQTTTTVHYDWDLLNNRDIGDKYALALRNKFDALQEKAETHTPNDKYENFVNAHLEAAVKCIPTKQRTKLRVP